MELTPAQDTIAQDTHRFRVLICGRKFGKTTISSQEILGFSIYRDKSRILYVAPTLGDARRLMWDRLHQLYGKSIIKDNDTRMELRVPTVNKSYSDVFLGSWELVQNYRGDEYDFIIFDEVQEYKNFWLGWQEAMRPTLTPRKGQALFMGTPKGFNHLYDLYNLPLQDKDFMAYKFTSYDNPHIDVSEIEKAKQELTEDRFAQEYMADFRKSEGLVFKEFDRNKHIFSQEVTGEYIAGVDWGYTNPTAIPHIIIHNQCYFVIRELYKTGMTEDEVSDYIANQRFSKVYPDPESASAIAALKKKGVNTREVKKGKDSIQHGIQTMRELFKQNRLFIHKSCINTIAELEMYAYPEKSLHHNENENPQDEYNHAIDAIRYVVDNHVMAKPYVARPFHDNMKTIWAGR
jgi:hypothetical protein